LRSLNNAPEADGNVKGGLACSLGRPLRVVKKMRGFFSLYVVRRLYPIAQRASVMYIT